MSKTLIKDAEERQLAERDARLSTQSAGEAWSTEIKSRQAFPDRTHDVFHGLTSSIKPRKAWLEDRARDLAHGIHAAIAFGNIRGDNHDVIQGWIDELQDLWQLIES
ncbi:MAG TPA: hypothetical protein VJU84_08775 [Pyrinomonadaceae bacterium]|nr:hypothetical protein [Pyrinomonadaceae bacterium]